MIAETIAPAKIVNRLCRLITNQANAVLQILCYRTSAHALLANSITGKAVDSLWLEP